MSQDSLRLTSLPPFDSVYVRMRVATFGQRQELVRSVGHATGGHEAAHAGSIAEGRKAGEQGRIVRGLETLQVRRLQGTVWWTKLDLPWTIISCV